MLYIAGGDTPYAIGGYTTTVVQRFDPTIGQWGKWANVGEVTGIPEPVGFVVDEQGWSEGRTDTPPFERYQRPAPLHVASTLVTLSDGTTLSIVSSGDPEQQGSHMGGPSKGAPALHHLDQLVLAAIDEVGLNPAR